MHRSHLLATLVFFVALVAASPALAGGGFCICGGFAALAKGEGTCVRSEAECAKKCGPEGHSYATGTGKCSTGRQQRQPSASSAASPNVQREIEDPDAQNRALNDLCRRGDRAACAALLDWVKKEQAAAEEFDRRRKPRATP